MKPVNKLKSVSLIRWENGPVSNGELSHSAEATIPKIKEMTPAQFTPLLYQYGPPKRASSPWVLYLLRRSKQSTRYIAHHGARKTMSNDKNCP